MPLDWGINQLKCLLTGHLARCLLPHWRIPFCLGQAWLRALSPANSQGTPRPTDVPRSQNYQLSTGAFWISICKHGNSLWKKNKIMKKEGGEKGKKNHDAKEKCELRFSSWNLGIKSSTIFSLAFTRLCVLWAGTEQSALRWAARAFRVDLLHTSDSGREQRQWRTSLTRQHTGCGAIGSSLPQEAKQVTEKRKGYAQKTLNEFRSQLACFTGYLSKLLELPRPKVYSAGKQEEGDGMAFEAQWLLLAEPGIIPQGSSNFVNRRPVHCPLRPLEGWTDYNLKTYKQ